MRKTYKLEFTDDASHQFNEINGTDQLAISKYLEKVIINPKKYLKRFSFGGYYKFFANDYRILIEIREQISTIFVVDIEKKIKN